MGMANRIREQRLLLGLIQEELGQKLGLQKSAIAKYENGRVENIKRSVIKKMAEVLNCSPCYLMGWDDAPEQTPAAALTSDESALLSNYQKLNGTGKEKARDYVEDLSEQEKYTQDASFTARNAG